jgi:hypothetical protein
LSKSLTRNYAITLYPSYGLSFIGRLSISRSNLRTSRSGSIETWTIDF